MTVAIYIVDDDEAMRVSLDQLLHLRGDTVTRSFASGEEFLAAHETLEPGCLLLDLNMPGVSGMGVLEVLAPLASRFATIMLTAQGDIGSAVAAMKAGAVDFLEKPFHHSALLQAIDTAHARLLRVSAETDRMEQARGKLAQLSSRQLEVLKGLIEGQSNKAIAFQLDISPRTVEIYRAKLMEKLEVRSLSEALGIAFAAGLFNGPASPAPVEDKESDAR